MAGARKEEVLVFQRFSKMREEREGGFTLIELLVVILIIAILAAIAIPVFLRQREKGWRSQVESALKNAATAEESYLTTNPGYTSTEADLVSEGFKKASRVVVEIAVNGGTGYCILGQHQDLGVAATDPAYWYHSQDGRPVTTRPSYSNPTCPSA
jgi:type IV pilus assembly protein PilA